MKKQEEILQYIVRLESMIDSCYAYGGAERNSYNFERYIKPNGKKLNKKMFNEVYERRLNYLKKCTIEDNVYTDSEGCSYNQINYI